MQAINTYLEHTNLKPTITGTDVEQLISEAIAHKMFGVCVPPFWVKKARRDLGKSPVQLITVAGFPLAFSRSEPKLLEIEKALAEGADEIDAVFNLTAFKSGNSFWAKVEISQFAKLVHEANKMLKIIIETAYLNPAEIKLACKLCADAGADFVKTSTGYAPSGATVTDVQLMRSVLPESVGVKASGGIRSLASCQALIAAGAERIGTSAGVEIMEEVLA